MEMPPSVTVAMGKAAEAKKNVLLEFFSYNSVESKMVRDNVLASPNVKPVLKELVILIPVEHEKEKDLCLRYGISRVPALVLITPEGKEIDRLLGSRAPEELLRLLRDHGGDMTSVSGLMAKAAKRDAGAEAHLALANAFNMSGKEDQALGEISMSLDMAAEPGPDRKYLKMVLTQMASLAKHMPQMQEALQSRRDALERNRALTVDGASVLFAYNEAMKEQTRNVDYYLMLSPDNPLRRQIFPLVFVQLVEAKHYTEATSQTDLEMFVANYYPSQAAHSHNHMEEGHNAGAQEQWEKQIQQRLAGVASAAVQALLATDRLEKAKKIAGRLLETYDTPEIRRWIEQAAQRSASQGAANFTTWLQAAYPAKTKS